MSVPADSSEAGERVVSYEVLYTRADGSGGADVGELSWVREL